MTPTAATLQSVSRVIRRALGSWWIVAPILMFVYPIGLIFLWLSKSIQVRGKLAGTVLGGLFFVFVMANAKPVVKKGAVAIAPAPSASSPTPAPSPSVVPEQAFPSVPYANAAVAHAAQAVNLSAVVDNSPKQPLREAVNSGVKSPPAPTPAARPISGEVFKEPTKPVSNSKSPAGQMVPPPSSVGLGVGVDDFIVRFNKVATEAKSSLRISDKMILRGEVQDALQYTYAGECALIAAISTPENMVNEVTVLTLGELNVKDNVEFMTGVGCAMGAVSPELSEKERGRIFLEVVNRANDTPEKIVGIETGGKAYWCMRSKIVGTSFGISSRMPGQFAK